MFSQAQLFHVYKSRTYRKVKVDKLDIWHHMNIHKLVPDKKSSPLNTQGSYLWEAHIKKKKLFEFYSKNSKSLKIKIDREILKIFKVLFDMMIVRIDPHR